MICPKCGKEVKDGAKFCEECGASLTGNAPDPVSVGIHEKADVGAMSMEQIAENHKPRQTDALQPPEQRCASCGTVFKKEVRFCPNCGGAVSSAPAVSVPIPQQEPPAPAVGVSTARKSARNNAIWYAAVALVGIINYICFFYYEFVNFSYIFAGVIRLGFLVTFLILLILGVITSVLIIRKEKEKKPAWYMAFPIAGFAFFLFWGFFILTTGVGFYFFLLVMLLSWIVIAVRLFMYERKNISWERVAPATVSGTIRRSNKVFCVNCGTKIEDGVKFCPGCGVQGVAAGVSINQRYCFSCGSVINKAAATCPFCGVSQGSVPSGTGEKKGRQPRR